MDFQIGDLLYYNVMATIMPPPTCGIIVAIRETGIDVKWADDPSIQAYSFSDAKGEINANLWIRYPRQ